MKTTLFATLLLLAGTAFAASAPPDPAETTLTATYIFASHSVTLNWTASTDSSATTPASYNIYRASTTTDCTAATGFVKITATPVSALTFTDTGVTVGESLCYAASTVISGLEGNQSAPVLARILPAAPVLGPPITN